MEPRLCLCQYPPSSQYWVDIIQNHQPEPCWIITIVYPCHVMACIVELATLVWNATIGRIFICWCLRRRHILHYSNHGYSDSGYDLQAGWQLNLSALSHLPGRQNCGLRMCRKCRERFPHHRRLAVPTCITVRVWRTCRDACRDCSLETFFEVGGGENVPGIPGECASRNFAYLVRDPYQHHSYQ